MIPSILHRTSDKLLCSTSHISRMASSSYSTAIKATAAAPTESEQGTTPSTGDIEKPAATSRFKDYASEPRRGSPSPSQRPQLRTEEERVYVLTISTDKAHHERMNALRKKYFPPKLNKLGAHITLFHALPESKLETDVIPMIKTVCSTTNQFPINANSPAKLGKHGFGVYLPDHPDAARVRNVHQRLLDSWKGKGWLSEQDSHPIKPHYTIMNKVDDEREVAKALKEVRESVDGDRGVAEGLSLWLYDRGRWRWREIFRFTCEAPT